MSRLATARLTGRLPASTCGQGAVQALPLPPRLSSRAVLPATRFPHLRNPASRYSVCSNTHLSTHRRAWTLPTLNFGYFSSTGRST